MQHESKKAQSKILYFMSLLCGVLAVAWAFTLLRTAPDTPLAPNSADVSAADAASAQVAPLAGARRLASLPLKEQTLPQPRSFDSVYADIFKLHRGTSNLGPATDDPDKGLNQSATARASELYAEMVAVAPDAGERVLGILTSLSTPWKDGGADTKCTLVICRLILDFNLQQLTADAHLAGKRPHLVESCLMCMPLSVEFAALMHRLLKNKPYLEAVHEKSLLQLSRDATGDRAFMAPLLRDLLITLWRNVRKGGDGDCGDLLAYFENADGGALNSAATQRLILSDRYRHLAVARLVESRDSSLMSEAAMFAARNLPFEAAIEVIATLRSSFDQGQVHFSAYAQLAESAPKAMASHYEACLASGTRPGHREQLVSALGNYATQTGGLDTAIMAFDMDPEPRVKGVALLAIASGGPLAAFQERFTRALGDQSFAQIPRPFLTAALTNVAPRAEVNWLANAIERLLATSGLSAGDRQAIGRIKTEYLPH